MGHTARKRRRHGDRRQWRRRLLGAAIGIFAGLTLAEITLRVLGYSPANVNPLRAFHRADPVLVYRGRANVEGRFRRSQFDVTVRHDDRGFRMPELSRDRSQTKGCIHVLGDSFTWGWGVETGEVFTDRLRHALPEYAVRNYGINAGGTAQQTALLESEVAAEVRPGDDIVLMFFYNDFYDNTHETRLHGRIEGGRVVTVVPESNFGPTVSAWLKDHSYLANFAAHAWDMRKANAIAAEQRHGSDPRGPGPKAVDKRVTLHFLQRFRDLCAASRATLTVVWIPDSRDVAARARGESSVFHDAFVELAKRAGVTTLNPTDAFLAASKGGKPLYFNGDQHWTPAGHVVMAHVLADAWQARRR